MRRLAALVAACGLVAGATAQPALPPQFRIEPIATPDQSSAVPLYPAGAGQPAAEQWDRLGGGRIVRNVVVPSITPVLPDPARATGAAVIVAPGGAFLSLSMDSEGFDVAHWLADHGIAAFVLKYRLNATPREEGAFMARVAEVFGGAGKGDISQTVFEPRATEDALHALRLVREHAANWRVDPARVGMIGFSAGAMTAMQAVMAPDPAARPAFFGYIYGPMRAMSVPTAAPPMFAAIALDDGLFGRQGFGVVEAWHQAGRPVELHAYERGDHGFGMGRPGTTTTLVLPEFFEWMKDRALLAPNGTRP